MNVLRCNWTVLPLLVAFALVTMATNAVETDVETYLDARLVQTSGHPVIAGGKFYGYRSENEGSGQNAFALCTNLSVTSGVPLVMIWGTRGCKYCNGLAMSMNEDTELAGWLASRRAVFAYFKDGVDQAIYNTPVTFEAAMREPQKSAYMFARENGAPPSWPLYVFWMKNSDGSVVKQAGSWQNGDSAGFREAFESFAANNRIDIRTESAPEEDIIPGDAEFACGSVPGARLEAMPSTKGVWVPVTRPRNFTAAAENTLTAIFPDGFISTSNVVWKAGAEKQTQEVFIPTAAHWADGGSAVLQLRDAEGVLNATNAITFVAEYSPSHHFPLWIGERTEDSLGWGEWTFDFDIATNKARRAAASCIDAYTLVVAGGGLWCPDCIRCEEHLTAGEYADRFADWARANKIALVVSDQPRSGTTTSSMVTHDVGGRGANVTSGSYYLSRKGLTIAEGMVQFSAMTNRSYRLWKVEPDALRVSNPTFMLFRSDGTIAGRLVGDVNMRRVRNGSSANSEPFDFDENIARLTELVALASDTTEEKNGKPGTTALPSHVFGATNTCTLGAADLSDVFPFSGAPAGEAFRVVVEKPEGAKSEPAARILMLTDAATGAFVEIPTLAADQNAWRLTAEQVASNLFIEVSAFAEARYTTYGGNTTMSVKFHTETLPAGELTFSKTSATAVEGKDAAFVLEIARSGGSAGKAAVSVSLDLSGISATDLLRIGWNLGEDHRIEWADMETATKTISVPIFDDGFWDGDSTFAFRLSSEQGAAIGSPAVCEVTVRDNDMKSRGRIRIAKPEPDALGNVYVHEGEPFEVCVERIGGTYGDASAILCAGNITTNLTWTSGERTLERNVPIDISGLTADDSLTIQLSDVLGSEIDHGAKFADVHIVARDVPVLLPAEEPLNMSANVRCGKVVATAGGDFDRSVLVCASGRNAKGISLAFDRETGEVLIQGVAEETGSFSVTYRLLRLSDDGRVECSAPVKVAYTVGDICEAVPALASARTWRGLPMTADGGVRLAGLLDLTVPSSGKTSAKFRTTGGICIVFSGSCWTSEDDDGVQEEIDALRKGWTLTVAARADGTVDCSIVDPEGVGYSCKAPEIPWAMQSAMPFLSRWRGTYTVEMPADTAPNSALCIGPATTSLRYTTDAAVKIGAVTYAGSMPNGRVYSGTAYLQPSKADELLLPLLATSSSDTLGAILRVRGDGASIATQTRQVILAEDATEPYWVHNEGALTTASYEVPLRAYGSYYVAEEWVARLLNDYGAKALALKFEAAGSAPFDWAVYGNATTLELEGSTPDDLIFTFVPSSGTLRGGFSTMINGGLRTVSFRGVVLPGWATGCGCGFDDGSAGEGIVRPFVTAAAWWNERRRFYGEDGNERQRSVKVGCCLKTEL